MKLRVVPLNLSEANDLVARWHRHHKPVIGARFALGAENGELRGAVIVGRPVARMVDAKKVAEVTRLVTDGTKNTCSLLYAAAARSCREMGFEMIQTYILESEDGTSLKAAGWERDPEPCGGGDWNHRGAEQQSLFGGANRRTDQPMGKKWRWFKLLQAGAFRRPVEETPHV